MILTTTDSIDGREVATYFGVVSGECIVGANIFKDFFAGIRDIVGGRAGGYETAMRDAKQMAIEDMTEEARRLGADAILAIDLDYEALSRGSSQMLMVSANGTAVRLKETR